MILSYRKTKEGTSKPTYFEDKIKLGVKIHTIRADVKNRWKAGMKIHQANGVRTKYYNCFQEDVCTGVQKVVIKLAKTAPPNCNKFYLRSKVIVDGKELNLLQKKALAYNDGFDSLIAFFNWFNEDLEGKLIHWTDKRY